MGLYARWICASVTHPCWSSASFDASTSSDVFGFQTSDLPRENSKMLARSIKTISFKVSSRYLSHSSLIANFLNMSSISTINIIPILFYLTHLRGGFPYMLHMFPPTHPACVGKPLGVAGDRDLQPPLNWQSWYLEVRAWAHWRGTRWPVRTGKLPNVEKNPR